MYTQILVAVDLSELSREVFAQALSLAQKSNARMLLLHVLTSQEENSPMPVSPDISAIYPAAGNDWTLRTWQLEWAKFEQEGLELLQAYLEKAKAAGVSTEIKQIQGNPGQSICNLANIWQADLIVVGRKGQSGLSEMILGSVSNHVLHHAPCSVLIVQS